MIVWLVACGPPDLGVGVPVAHFELRAADGEVAGEVTLEADGDALLERLVLENGARRDLRLDAAGVTVVARLGRRWVGWTQRGAAWTRREGVVVERRELDGDWLGADGDLWSGGFGPSAAAWWREAPQLEEGERVRVDVVAGRVEPLRLERRAVDATGDRWFAWSPAHGASIWRDDEGRLGALEGFSGGHAAVRDGFRVPPVVAPALPRDVDERDLRVETGGAVLVGRRSGPVEPGPGRPGVVVVHGSGPLDRDGLAPGLEGHIYQRLAWAMSRRGAVVARYDKRGVGESEREDEDDPVTADVLVGDALAVLHAVANDPEVDPDCLVVVGHSEGGLLAPEIAAAQPGVRGLVLLAAPARGLLDTLESQGPAIARAHGASEAEVAALARRQQVSLRLLRSGKDVEVPGVRDVPGAAWMRSHVGRDPAAVLAGLHGVSVLALYGEQDLQVLPAAELEPMRRATAHLDAELRVVPGMDHVLADAGPWPGMGRYVDPDRQPLPAVMDDVARWVGDLCPRPDDP